MNAPFNRRHLLSGIPAFGFGALIAAGATPVQVAAAPTETPVRKLFREWQRLYEIEKQVHEASPTGSDADTRAATEALMAIEKQMMEIPSTGAEDWMFKMSAISCFGIFPPESEDDPIWVEARALVAA